MKRQVKPPIIPVLENETDHHLFEVNAVSFDKYASLVIPD